jgi:hypothetical protein
MLAIAAERDAAGADGRAHGCRFFAGREANIKRFFVFDKSPFVRLQISDGLERRARSFGRTVHTIHLAVHHEKVAPQNGIADAHSRGKSRRAEKTRRGFFPFLGAQRLAAVECGAAPVENNRFVRRAGLTAKRNAFVIWRIFGRKNNHIARLRFIDGLLNGGKFAARRAADFEFARAAKPPLRRVAKQQSREKEKARL